MSNHLIKAGQSGHGPYQVDVSATDANWEYCGLSVVALGRGESVELSTMASEYLVLPLEGSVQAEVDGAHFELKGRNTIFGETTDYLYVPRDASLKLTSPTGGRFALPNARVEKGGQPRYCPSGEVRVELRGAGNCSRQIVNYAINNAVETEHLLVCEVLTPGGNWSSYPPHKHDEASETERELEEIYYFEIRDAETGPGFAFHSTYGTSERPIEVAARVHSGDLALVPHGWHGPCVAAPGYDLYYLNVMAGPAGPEWMSVDDPCFGWVRSTWETQTIDPRLPMPVKEA